MVTESYNLTSESSKHFSDDLAYLFWGKINNYFLRTLKTVMSKNKQNHHRTPTQANNQKFLRKPQNHLPRKSLITLLQTFMRPHLHQCGNESVMEKHL